MHYQIKAPVLAVAVLLLLLSFLSFPARAIEPPAPAGPECELPWSDRSPYLGSYDVFGRWENGVVPIAYNHSGAPADHTAAEMEIWIHSAFAVIEGMAEVRFDYRGMTEADWEVNVDSLAVIAWSSELPSRVVGRARLRNYVDIAVEQGQAPDEAVYDRNGYWPYVDGSVRLNPADRFFDAGNLEVRGLAILIHELLHLLGLGHSENPVSIMNYLFQSYHLPRVDDVDALQALYGPPDEFSLPTPGPELRADRIPPGVTTNPVFVTMLGLHPVSRTRGYLPGYPRALGEDFVIDESFADIDRVRFTLDFRGADPGTEIRLWWTDPLGYRQEVLDSQLYMFGSQSSSMFFESGTVGQFRLVPGVWTLSFGMGEALVAEGQFRVSGSSFPFNRTPSARLNVGTDGNGGYNLNLHASDPESDRISSRWHIPGTAGHQDRFQVHHDPAGENPDPLQIFVEVYDDADRERDYPNFFGTGFGALENRYLATPAEPNVPTFFTSHGLLHVPAIGIGGGGYSLHFKLTALDGITFKFLAFDNATPVSGGGASFDPTDSSIYMPKMIVVDGDTQTAYFDLRFEVDFDAQPIRMTLR